MSLVTSSSPLYTLGSILFPLSSSSPRISRRVVLPLILGFEDARDFSVTKRLKTSVRVNLVFYSVVGSIGLVGLVLFISMNRNWCVGVLGLAMALSNTFGLVIGTFLLGFGFSEVPKTLWRNADWTIRLKVLSHKIAKMTVKLDDAHQELSNVIVVFVGPIKVLKYLSHMMNICLYSNNLCIYIYIYCVCIIIE